MISLKRNKHSWSRHDGENICIGRCLFSWRMAFCRSVVTRSVIFNYSPIHSTTSLTILLLSHLSAGWSCSRLLPSPILRLAWIMTYISKYIHACFHTFIIHKWWWIFYFTLSSTYLQTYHVFICICIRL